MKYYLNHREKNLHQNVFKTYTLQWCVSQPLPLESDKKVCNRPDNDRSYWLLVHVYVLVCQDCSHIYIYDQYELKLSKSLLSGIVHIGVS